MRPNLNGPFREVVGLGFCLLFYILATFEVISGWVPTCDSVHSWYSAVPLGKQAAITMS